MVWGLFGLQAGAGDPPKVLATPPGIFCRPELTFGPSHLLPNQDEAMSRMVGWHHTVGGWRISGFWGILPEPVVTGFHGAPKDEEGMFVLLKGLTGRLGVDTVVFDRPVWDHWERYVRPLERRGLLKVDGTHNAITLKKPSSEPV